MHWQKPFTPLKMNGFWTPKNPPEIEIRKIIWTSMTLGSKYELSRVLCNSWDPTVGRFHVLVSGGNWDQTHDGPFIKERPFGGCFFGLFLNNMEPEEYVFGKAKHPTQSTKFWGSVLIFGGIYTFLEKTATL